MSERVQRVRMRFVGMDGSAGLRKGKVYDLTVTLTRFGYPILVVVGDQQIPYGSLLGFTRNWQEATRDE